MTTEQLELKLSRRQHSPLFARLASDYLAAGKIEEAKNLCFAGLERYPSYPTARLVLARCFAREMDFSSAISTIRQLREMAPDLHIVDQLEADWQESLRKKLTSSLDEMRAVQTSDAVYSEPGPETAVPPAAAPEDTAPSVEAAPAVETAEPAPATDLAGAVEQPPEETPAGMIGTAEIEVPVEDRLEEVPAEQGAPMEESPPSEPAPVIEQPADVQTDLDVWGEGTQEQAPAEEAAPDAEEPASVRVEDSSAPEKLSEPEAIDTGEPAVTGGDLTGEEIHPAEATTGPEAEDVPAVDHEGNGSGRRSVEAEHQEPDVEETLATPEPSPVGGPPDAESNLDAVLPGMLQKAEGSSSWRIVSKTLAEIYAKQGAYGEAIITYELLKKQYPARASEFENRIRELAGKMEAKQ